MKPTDVIIGLGRPIAYYPGFTKITGSVSANVFLCQFIHWIGKEGSGNGWIYKTSDEIEQETGLSYGEQVTARKKLRTLGFLQERNAKLEHRIYYFIDMDKINKVWENPPKSVIRSSRTPKGQFRKTGEVELASSEIPAPLTETTAKTTPQNTNIVSEKQELAEQEQPALPPAIIPPLQPPAPVQPPVQPTRKLAKEDSLSLTLRFMTKQQDKQSTLRLETFPEDVREIIGRVCELWNLTPPQKNGGARASSDLAYWIRGARDLREACGDIGMPVIEKMREDYERSMKKNHDVVPYQVATPKSLIRVAQSTYAVMSQPSLGNQGGDASETDLDNYLKSGSR